MSETTGKEQVRPFQPHQGDRRSREEDQAWAYLYASIHEPSTAEEVVRNLDGDVYAKRNHLALYIRAKKTLRKQKASDARNERIGRFLRQIVAAVVFGPFRLLRLVACASGNAAVELLPPVGREPARTRTGVLRSDPAFARARREFAGAASSGPATGEDSRDVKAA